MRIGQRTNDDRCPAAGCSCTIGSGQGTRDGSGGEGRGRAHSHTATRVGDVGVRPVCDAMRSHYVTGEIFMFPFFRVQHLSLSRWWRNGLRAAPLRQREYLSTIASWQRSGKEIRGRIFFGSKQAYWEHGSLPRCDCPPRPPPQSTVRTAAAI